ncbi:MAG: hypothetical protein AAGB93_07940 [Planctomycetota bacterium]
MLRPQPIDLAPWPLGGLLVPDVPGGRALAEAAVAGTSADLTEEVTFWAHAAGDDTDAAQRGLDALAATLDAGEDRDVVAYDRFVLSPSADELERLRGELTGLLADLLEVAAFRCGLRSDLPAFDHLDGELLAAARATAASAAMEAGDEETAERALSEAIDLARGTSPGLAAQLLVSRLEGERSRGADSATVVSLLEEALETLGATGFDALRAELQLELAVVLQETDPRRLPDAAAMFQAAITSLDSDLHPRAHGFAQMRHGLCYMSMPMADAGDALRMGVATQALKRAVEVLDQEREPDLWCAAVTNLANAYQMLPSGHLEKNLGESVTLYDRALAVRTADGDPVGHARLHVNRANACASLERFDEAVASLRIACPILQTAGAGEDFEAARKLLQDLERSRLTAGESA